MKQFITENWIIAPCLLTIILFYYAVDAIENRKQRLREKNILFEENYNVIIKYIQQADRNIPTAVKAEDEIKKLTGYAYNHETKEKIKEAVCLWKAKFIHLFNH
jgi:hypothetical protein